MVVHQYWNLNIYFLKILLFTKFSKFLNGAAKERHRIILKLILHVIEFVSLVTICFKLRLLFRDLFFFSFNKKT